MNHTQKALSLYVDTTEKLRLENGLITNGHSMMQLSDFTGIFETKKGTQLDLSDFTRGMNLSKPLSEYFSDYISTDYIPAKIIKIVQGQGNEPDRVIGLIAYYRSEVQTLRVNADYFINILEYMLNREITEKDLLELSFDISLDKENCRIKIKANGLTGILCGLRN